VDFVDRKDGVVVLFFGVGEGLLSSSSSSHLPHSSAMSLPPQPTAISLPKRLPQHPPHPNPTHPEYYPKLGPNAFHINHCYQKRSTCHKITKLYPFIPRQLPQTLSRHLPVSPRAPSLKAKPRIWKMTLRTTISATMVQIVHHPRHPHSRTTAPSPSPTFPPLRVFQPNWTPPPITI
jgi:hypothetical protein